MNKPKVSIIVAIDEDRGIGKNNDLLFRIPEDFKRMKEKTTGHPIIMGRKTYNSIGRLLPNRTNIIVTRDLDFKIDGAIIANSLEDGIAKAQQSSGSEEIFIFGGGQIFKEALEKDLVDRIYLTIVKGHYGADTFFPEYESLGFKKINEEEHESDGYHYSFIDLEK